jgi:hypothetical protein
MAASERETAMIEAFAQTMRTVLDPVISRLERLERGPATPDKKTADETMAEMMAAIRGQSEDVAKIGLVQVVDGCTSDLGVQDVDGQQHGATFDAELHFAPVVVNGKIIGKSGAPIVRNLLNYKLPAGHDRHLNAGGLVPNGMSMKELGMDHQEKLSDGYKQWLWETFWQADLRRFVGRQLPPHVRPQAPSVQSA